MNAVPLASNSQPAAGPASFDVLNRDLESKMASLKQLMLWRSVSTQDVLPLLRQVSSSLSEIEHTVARMSAQVEDELRYIPLCQHLKDAISHQRAHIEYVRSTMPDKLPQNQTVSTHNNASTSSSAGGAHSTHGPKKSSGASVSFANLPNDSKAEKEKESTYASRIALLTVTELNDVPQYMKGRLTLDKVNTAIEEVNALLNRKFTLWTMPIAKIDEGSRDVYHAFRESETPETKGTVFITDAELKQHCPSFKMDASARGLTQLLRHLGRVREVRSATTKSVSFIVI
jgi:hypothetical protein